MPAQRVLVIEDDPVVAEAVVAALSTLDDVDLVLEDDGRRALVRIATGEWALVVSDIELPGANGMQILQAVKDASPDTPVVLMTAHAQLDYAIEAVRLHADEFLVKPIDVHDLRRKAGGLLTRSRPPERHVGVLAIGAHPDDVELGCGGTLLAHAAAGDTVTMLTLTGGGDGAAAARATEARESALLLGVDLVHRELHERDVPEGGETVEAIGREIERLEPSFVYTHSLHDADQDHRSVHRATVVAARGVANLFAYQAPSTGVEFSPGRFVDVTPHMERKLRALQAFASGHETRRYLDEELVTATARYWSRFGTGRYVEPLEVLRTTEAALSPGAEAAGRAAAP